MSAFQTRIFEEPELEFGDHHHHPDPRLGLFEAGPLQPFVGDVIKIGVVGSAKTIEDTRKFIQTAASGIDGKSEKHPNMHPAFPGLGNQSPYRCRFEIEEGATAALSQSKLDKIAKEPDHQLAVEMAVHEILAELQAFDDGGHRPHVAIIALPVRLLERVWNAKVDAGGTTEEEDSSGSDAPNFRGMLKARAMGLNFPIQIVWEDVVDDKVSIPQKVKESSARKIQDMAGRSWNLLTTLYYKGSGRIPWRRMPKEGEYTACYVGISFYREAGGQQLFTSAAQMAKHHFEHEKPSAPQSGAEALVDNLMADWLKYHVSNLAAGDRYGISVDHWTAFFDAERRAGRLPTAITVRHLTPHVQARFREWRASAGAGGHTVSRDLAALRGALNWAWKHQRIEHPPFIADVPPHQKAPARDRILTLNEVAALMDACVGREDREHLLRFIIIELGIAGRPEAVLELTSDNVDLRRGLIDPNHAGRVHARKRRPVVPIAKAVRPWVSGVDGKLITYRVPIADKNRTPGGPTHFERPTSSIKTAWKAACADAGVEGATPKTLRHTMLTWLAERGVPSEQRQMLAGHRPQGTTAKNYEHLSPTYLRAAIAEVDAYFDELAKLTRAHLRYGNDTGSNEPMAA